MQLHRMLANKGKEKWNNLFQKEFCQSNYPTKKGEAWEMNTFPLFNLMDEKMQISVKLFLPVFFLAVPWM